MDPLGNWDETDVDSVTEARTHNAVNELTARTVGQDPQVSLTYDDAGNLTQDGSAEGDHQYVWDYRNRLIEVKEKQSGNWNIVGEYKYDAGTRRVLKVVTNKGALNGTTRFLWGGDSDWQCVEERSGGGDLVARYTYSPGYIDAVAVQERDLNADDDFGDAGAVVYYHSSTLFSVYALTDADESVVERYRYNAYGGDTVLDADWAGDTDGLSDVLSLYAFTGRRLAPEGGLMQYRYRYYEPALGRLIGRDPIHAANLYAYVVDQPTWATDPLGLHAAGTLHNYYHEIGWYSDTHGGTTAPYSGSAYQYIYDNNPNGTLAGGFADLAGWTTFSIQHPGFAALGKKYLRCCDKGNGNTIYTSVGASANAAIITGVMGEAGLEVHLLCDTRQICVYGHAGVGAGPGWGAGAGINGGGGHAWGVHTAGNYSGYFGTTGVTGGTAIVGGYGGYSSNNAIPGTGDVEGYGGGLTAGLSIPGGMAYHEAQAYVLLYCMTVPPDQ